MNAGEHTSWTLGRETTWGVEPMRSFPLDVFGKKLIQPRKECLDTRFSVALQGNRDMNNTP